MKKVFRFLAIAAFAFGMTAMVACGDNEEEGGGNGGNGGNEPETGEPVLLNETFDNGIPTTWANIDADGDGYKWELSATRLSNPRGVNGSECAISASYINGIGVLNADNYLVTPTFHIPNVGGYNLTYNVANFQLEYPDAYSVMVGTLSNGVFTPAGTLFSGRSEAGVFDGDGFEQKTFNLDAYKGQDVCIAFRHNDSDAYFLMIDNVKVSNE